MPPAKNRGHFLLKHILTLILIVVPVVLSAGQIPGVCHNELTAWIKAKQALTIVDIQDAEGFRAHNYVDSLAAGGDPLRLKNIAARVRSTKGKVIVVSASGGADAVRAMEVLVRGGVQRPRILLLEGGMAAAAGNAACDCCKPPSSGGASK